MNSIFKFNKTYFILAVIIFVTEVLIALYVHDKIIRPYIGDLLVVILIYCAIKSILNISVLATSIFVLLFSYTIEILQYFEIVKILGLQSSRIARIVIGTSFAWEDLLAYTAGVFIVLYFEKLIARKKQVKEVSSF